MMLKTFFRHPGRGGVTLVLLLALPLRAVAQHQEPPPPAAYALENVTVVYADGREEAGVNLVVRRGLIEAMGPGIPIPPDAERLEGDSLWVYPGMVDAVGAALMELPEPSREGVLSWDPPRDAQGFTPHRRVADFLTGTGADGRSQRNAGVIAAGIHPEGGMAPGQSATILYRMTTDTPWDLVAEPSIGLSFTFQGSRTGYPSSLFAVIAHFRQMFEDAGHHALVMAEYARNSRGLTLPPWDPDMEALASAASGELPVFFRAEDDEEIRRVLMLADEIGFRPVIVGGEEAWQLADELAARDIPVLVSVAFPAPREWKPPEPGTQEPGEETDMPEGGMERPQPVSPEEAGEAPPQPEEAVQEEELEPAAAREKERLENAYANPGRLLAAGVTVALTSGGGEGELREGVVKAMEYGLSEGAALEAVTTTPAALLGIPSVVTLGRGMAANFIVTDGRLFGEDTGVRYTFVEGEMEKGGGGRRGGGGEAPAVDVTGTWTITVGAQGMELPFTLTLTQDGASFSGSMVNPEMGEAQVEDGVVSGNSITFTVVFSQGGESVEIESSGTVEGDQMTGSGTSDMIDITFTGTRRPGQGGGIR